MRGKHIFTKISAFLLTTVLLLSLTFSSFAGFALVVQNVLLSNQMPIYNTSGETASSPNDSSMDGQQIDDVVTGTPAAPPRAESSNATTLDELGADGSSIEEQMPEASTSESPSSIGQPEAEQAGSSTSQTAPIISSDPNAPKVHSKYAVLIDADTGSILYEKSARERTGPASTTKVMTAIVTLERIKDLSKMATVSAEVKKLGGDSSKMFVVEGEVLSVRDLLYGLMMVSGNDAAVTLAERVAGSQEAFVAMMNDKAEEIGLKDTHFANPHGLTDEQHYSTAADMAEIMRYAMANPDFAAIEAKPHYDRQPTNKNATPPRMHNANRFITSKESMRSFNWPACTGGKTGYTHAAQGCLIVSASNNGMNMIAVSLYDDSLQQLSRWDDTKNLIEYGFNNLVKMDLSAINFSNIKVLVDGYSKKDESEGALEVKVKADGIVVSGIKHDLEPIMNGTINLDIAPNINHGIALAAPIQQGQVVGTAAIMFGENKLADVDLLASRSIESSTDDPVNPVSTLFGTVGSDNNGFTAFLAKMFIGFGVVIILLIVVLLVRKIIFPKKQTRRRKPVYHQNASKSKSRYN